MNLLLQVLLFAVVFLAFFLSPLDTDLGWHLRYGESILKPGQFPYSNNLTYFLSDYKWANSYTLYQIITFLTYKAGGFWGLTLIYALLGVVTFWLFSKISPKTLTVNLFIFLAIIFFGWNVFSLGFRAQIFTFTFLILLIMLLKRVEERPKLAWVFPLLFLLWANLHGGFVLGLAVLMIYSLWLFVAEGWEKSQRLILATITSFITPLINPYGLSLYQETYKHSLYPLKDLIAEWVPPNLEVQVVIALISVVVIWLIFASTLKKKVFWLMTLVLFAFLALQARRNLPFVALFAALPLLEIFRSKLETLGQRVQFKKVALLGLGLAIIGLGSTLSPKTLSFNTDWQFFCSQGSIKYPCQGVEYLRKNELTGKKIFNAYEWGGFLEWQLPQYQYFVDGRMPAWPTKEGKSPYTLYLEVVQAKDGYQKKLDEYKTEVLFIGSGTFLDLELQKEINKIWKEIYRDQVAVIYTR